ncbi:Maf family protein [Acidisphaera rubrifaciens]|uniref:Nucleoside triphosphate pyrophosphatase n=1 Tax=Acidisphaera rubrifaciens HS-AP3 TaxID=1231350 RepID=A0A0D6P915_9PROT|nr:Maf family protein [Acidisphaera rubrifaciens]GAN77359.1 cell division inhibitor/septum formation inhibitor nucleotide-binding protein Maf [Acidisphaera rubrifaciens HS-AP3]
MIQCASVPLVLASQSTARAGLLHAAGLSFLTSPADLDETPIKAAARAAGRDAGTASLALAEAKACAVSRRRPDAMVIGADQILVCDGQWFDKPADLAGAASHLRALRGRTHTLATAAALARGGEVIWRHQEAPRLTMRAFSDAFLAAYLAAEGDAVRASVGAYRLEGLGAHLFTEVQGEHATILGLPLLALLAALRTEGVLTT